ncbi:unnamed protein product [Protopolystoma xenopodis]|uniref:Uncharacterized protein n=1 Tax=Protopolystoma xenopodis TaxID=117903 RepID=A0A448XH92_9PLAT|nr:unnamed protein product [Protopolystoma xenopodis]
MLMGIVIVMMIMQSQLQIVYFDTNQAHVGWPPQLLLAGKEVASPITTLLALLNLHKTSLLSLVFLFPAAPPRTLSHSLTHYLSIQMHRRESGDALDFGSRTPVRTRSFHSPSPTISAGSVSLSKSASTGPSPITATNLSSSSSYCTNSQTALLGSQQLQVEQEISSPTQPEVNRAPAVYFCQEKENNELASVRRLLSLRSHLDPTHLYSRSHLKPGRTEPRGRSQTVHKSYFQLQFLAEYFLIGDQLFGLRS